MLSNYDGIDFMKKNKDGNTFVDLIRKDKKLKDRIIKLFQNDTVNKLISLLKLKNQNNDNKETDKIPEEDKEESEGDEIDENS